MIPLSTKNSFFKESKVKDFKYLYVYSESEHYLLDVYEYGKDIIYTTERMSLNKNVLNQKYYIIIPYYPEELGDTNFDKEEIKNPRDKNYNHIE